MHPYSENIIFIDTEFSSNDPVTAQILSIGLVKMNGEELYLELDFDGPTSDWVKENILPTLNQEKLSKGQAWEKILAFVGDTRPYMIAFVNFFDSVYWSKLFFKKENPGDLIPPFFWIPIDFASILFSKGIDPESFTQKKGFILCRQFGIDITKYHVHNALDDARLLREVYLKLFKH